MLGFENKTVLNLLKDLENPELSQSEISFNQMMMRNPVVQINSKNYTLLAQAIITRISAAKTPEIVYEFSDMLHNLCNERDKTYPELALPVLQTFIHAATEQTTKTEDADLIFGFAARHIRKNGALDTIDNALLAQSVFNALNPAKKSLQGQSNLLQAFCANHADLRDEKELKNKLIPLYNVFSQIKPPPLHPHSSSSAIHQHYHATKICANLLSFIV